MKMRYYTGIGSDKAPMDVIRELKAVSLILALGYGYTLRTGAGDGAERAFRSGAEAAAKFHPCGTLIPSPEVYIPWSGYNGSDSPLSMYGSTAYHVAAAYIRDWDALSLAEKRKNVCDLSKVFGYDLKTDPSFVICWTPGGRGNMKPDLALRSAKEYHIPILDAGSFKNLDEFRMEVLKLAAAGTQKEAECLAAAAGKTA